MIIEWIIVGFFSAIGWGFAQKTVVEPYINPAFENVATHPTNANDTNKENK